MKYLLDTNAWIELLRDPQSPITSRVAAEPVGRIVLCSVCRAELLLGTERSPVHRKQLPQLMQFCRTFPSLPFDDVAAGEYSRIRMDVERTGKPIGPYDLLIAAIALANNLTLVTHNTREFSRIPGLKIEDWQ